ncbi:MAG: hypothetical protein GWO24_02700, partial [Akkermansiaceae bacterium]|nr:hypothetical protein [Akkermansiaceae bacterium]
MLLAATVRTKRSLNRPLMRAETSSRSFWVWACVLAVAWHVLFWIGLSGRRLPYPEATHASAHVSYLPGASSSRPDGRAARDTRGIWSPVLFALPSASGFSGPVLARAVSLRPPVDTPGDRSVLLPLTQLTRRPGSREVAGLQGPARLPDEFPLLPEKPPVFARAATLAAESPFHVTVSPGLTGAVNASDLLPAASG